jgi:hypothetical protein
MIGNIVGALVGREVERGRNEGQGGLKGAVLGVAAVSVLRRLGPLGVVLGGAYVARKALKRGRAHRNGSAAR